MLAGPSLSIARSNEEATVDFRCRLILNGYFQIFEKEQTLIHRVGEKGEQPLAVYDITSVTNHDY